MEAGGADKVPRVGDAEGFETPIEIKIKTLDSQTYTLRVDKQTPVPALKEQIASVTGVLSEQQRLICRGKVLKDDQLLSAYHVEDGHTLHLVVRQPIPPSESLPNHPGTDPASSATQGRVAPSVVIETFSLPDGGDAIPSEISRIVSAVLGSFGLSNIGSGIEGLDATRDRAMQTEQAGNRGGSDRSHSAFGFPTAVPFGSMQPPVVTDSLTTMSQYLSHIRHEFNAIGRGRENNAEADPINRNEPRDSSSTLQAGTVQERLPTPASLAEVLQSSRQLLIEEVAECLLQLGRQLESQSNVTDSALRLNTQSTASRTGFQLYNLGAFLLELGRATMTLQLGQAPSEAVVNTGPAVFINSSGPNPLMVQPLPFQLGTHFGNIPMGSVRPGSGSGGSISSGFLPRRIDIQIRRAATTNDNQQERGDTQQPSGQRHAVTSSGSENYGSQMSLRVSDGSSVAGEPGVRVVPIRTMVAAVPAAFSRIPFDSSGSSMGLYYPFLDRVQHLASVNTSGGQTSQSSGEHPTDVQAQQQLTPEPEPQQQTIEQRVRDVIGRLRDVTSGYGSIEQGPHVSMEHDATSVHAEQQSTARDGSLPSTNLRQHAPTTRSININVVSAGVTQNNQEPNEHVPDGMLFRLLRNLFPEGDIHVDDARTQQASTGAGPENSEPSARPVDAESGVTDEGLFFSNLLHQVMPFITQHVGAGTQDVAPGEERTPQHRRTRHSSTQTESSDAGTSRQGSDSDSDMPNPKRQKME